MNVLLDALAGYQVRFYTRCAISLLYVAGFTVLFSLSWKAGVGVALVAWALNADRRVG